MALLFTENWKSYDATNDLLKKWATAPTPFTWNATGGPDGGPYVSAATTGGIFMNGFGAVLNTSRFCFGMWVKFSGVVNNNAFLVFNTLAGTVCLQLRHMNDSSGRFILGDVNGTPMASSVRTICDGNWHWIECDINLAASGTYKISTDGVLEAQAVQGAGTTVASWFQLKSMTGITSSFGPMMIWDNAGSALTAANYPLGPRDISTIRPDGDGTVGFTRSTGSTNFSLVDEPDGDVTDYVESNVSGTQDLYNYAALGFNPAVINGVMVNSYVHNPLSGTINHQMVCKSGATTSPGASIITPAVTPRVTQQPFELDPNGNIPWTQTNLDAAQFGIKVV